MLFFVNMVSTIRKNHKANNKNKETTMNKEFLDKKKIIKNKKFLDDDKFIRKEIEKHIIFPLAFQNSEEKMKKAMIAKG